MMKAYMKNESASEIHTAKSWQSWGDTKEQAFENFKFDMEKQAKEKFMELVWVKTIACQSAAKKVKE